MQKYKKGEESRKGVRYEFEGICEFFLGETKVWTLRTNVNLRTARGTDQQFNLQTAKKIGLRTQRIAMAIGDNR